MSPKITKENHKKVKYPQAKAKVNVASKVNCSPFDPDEQEIPQRVLEIMEFQKKLKLMKKKKKEKKKKAPKGMESRIINTDFMTKDVELPGMSRPLKKPDIVVQKPGENEFKFMARLNESVQKSLREAYFEDRFKVQVKRNPLNSDVMKVVKDRPLDIDVTSTTKRKKKALSKSEKRKLKLAAKADAKSKQECVRDFSDYKDEVKFGETVHRPPEFKVASKLKLRTNFKERKPGSKNLLLKTILEGKDEEKIPLNLNNSKSEACKKMLEEERNRVVMMYRLMKSKKNVTL